MNKNATKTKNPKLPIALAPPLYHVPVSIYASGIKTPPHIQLTIVVVFESLTILENGLGKQNCLIK